MYSRDVQVLIDTKTNELIAFINDIVFFKCLLHVEWTPKTFPSVASRVFVKLCVTVENFVKGLFTRDFYHIVILCLHIDYSEQSGLLGKSPDLKIFVPPPRHIE